MNMGTSQREEKPFMAIDHLLNRNQMQGGFTDGLTDA
jgi:hypothetical protein